MIFILFCMKNILKVTLKNTPQRKEARHRGVHTVYAYYKNSTVNKSRWWLLVWEGGVKYKDTYGVAWGDGNVFE